MSNLPKWLIKKTPKQRNINKIQELLGDTLLCTVCQSALCPNIGECFSKNTLTFMILGNVCSRNCTFCAVSSGRPLTLDRKEPQNIAKAAKKLGLKYVVITSVTRDDLPDGGAGHFSACIAEIRKQLPEAKVEVLIPDLQGNTKDLKTILDAKPDVLNHNVETISRLYRAVRPQADFKRSLKLLKAAKELKKDIYTKSGFMVGLGEEECEVIELLSYLRWAEVDIVTLGQYLPPSKSHLPVREYVNPEIFSQYKAKAEKMGFLQVEAGPFVRSSYQAHFTWQKARS
ncbi:MAG: lipoyl synthase [Candidatus Margulisbacteria bacterium]|nr:lipoyl synthase [Candidatus Margulisiibacteriota bacterium]MBU1022383.1 lipoyl synthase [Candidatus Margulisiibacteriota bacterium]MBU1729065.1 lipoyl synthase [Candidatus Margulisiibacteriota bacterium]MBU1954514.1 lipoyl synthase [Candidatus Margulisiibacteriota bacterium]